MRNDSGVSYLDARGSADHILLTGHQGFWFDMKPSYEVSYRDRRLRGVMLFSVEEGVDYPWPGPKTNFGIHSTPWSSIVHVASSTPRDELPWRSMHSRGLLVAGAFATSCGPCPPAPRQSSSTSCAARCFSQGVFFAVCPLDHFPLAYCYSLLLGLSLPGAR